MSLSRPDLVSVAERLARGQSSSMDLLDRNLAAAEAPACSGAFIRRFDQPARAQAQAADALRAAGAPGGPLGGVAVSIKDLFDVAGQPTTGGSAAMADAAPAPADCPAVARLRKAGAVLVGHTNLSEFAFSGVGINPHHGTPANAGTLQLDATPRVPGGSTSGGATSVASGAAWAALGSDTGGSIRIPAALQGLVGFKNTQRLTPLEGCIPLSSSLDTACAITLSVRDAVRVHGVLAAREPQMRDRPIQGWRLAVPTTLMLDGLEPEVERAFHRALTTLRGRGAQIVELALPPLARLAALNAQGGFAAAESWAWHRARLAERGDRYDPRVAMRIRRGESMGAADYLDLIQARKAWVRDMDGLLEPFDAMLSPTVPMVAPPVEPLQADDAAFFDVNGRLLRNPSAVNFLDGCALSLPCQAPGELPVGLMVWGPAMADDRVLAVSLAIEAALAEAGVTAV